MSARLTMAVFAAASSLMLSAGPSSAMRVAPLAPAASSLPLEQVAEGCGRGWHRNRWGRCVPNRPIVRACPRGFHLNRWGRCVRTIYRY